KVPGLKERILGADKNPAQLIPAGVPQLQSGEVDATFTYLNGAADSQLQYLTLPDQINLSSPAYASSYAKATYTTGKGVTFRGQPIAYSAAVLAGAKNPAGATQFVQFAISPAGQDLVKTYHFLPGTLLVGGDKSALPPSLQPLVKGEYQL